MPARQPVATFGLDLARLRAGDYTDDYFNHLQRLLVALAAEGYRYGGEYPREDFPAPARWPVGEAVVEMQYFTRREPWSIACGVDEALAILSTCTGSLAADGAFHNTAAELSVEAVSDGDRLLPWEPAIRVRGRYRDFAILETMMLGALTRGTRVATNVDACLTAARGKPLLFFPARFDSYRTQAADGYAYFTAVAAYNARTGAGSPALVSTQAQGDWWGGHGGGTMAHAYLLCFLADTAEAALHFARLRPPQTPRIALVDTNNDCVTDSLRTARRLFAEFYRLHRAGQPEEAAKYRLQGVRPDTSDKLRDASVEALGDPALDCGVTPRLVTALRTALDAEGERAEVQPGDRELAREWFRGVGVVVTGGFTPERIAMFERLGVPVASYGVGSSLLRAEQDFTATWWRCIMTGRGGRWPRSAVAGSRIRGSSRWRCRCLDGCRGTPPPPANVPAGVCHGPPRLREHRRRRNVDASREPGRPTFERGLLPGR